MSNIHFGVDTLLQSHRTDLTGLRVGLVTNNAATTAQSIETPQGPLPSVTPSRRAIQRMGINLTTLFSPEHGLAVSASDGAHVVDEVDPLTGLPVKSLYGATMRPTPAMLADLDLLLFDIPDIGRTILYVYLDPVSRHGSVCRGGLTAMGVRSPESAREQSKPRGRANAG